MGRPGNVQEKGQLVVGLFSTHVAVEGVLVSMVAHVHGVHDGVLEENVTIRAVEHLILAPGFVPRGFTHADLQLLFLLLLLHGLWLHRHHFLRRCLPLGLKRLLQLEGRLALAPILARRTGR